MYWCAHTPQDLIEPDNNNFHNVLEVYSFLKSIIHFEHFERWSIDNFFDVIPGLTSLQYMLNKLNKVYCDKEIIIEI